MTSHSNSDGTPGDLITLVAGYVPVIDVSRRHDPADRRELARAVGAACETSGFLVIAGHGVPAGTIAAMYRATRAFFALPQQVKAALLAEPGDPLQRGFGRGGGDEKPPSEIGHVPTLPAELLETFIVNRYGELTAPPQLPDGAEPRHYLPNRWPQLPGFRDAYLAYYRAMEDLALDLMRLFALALDLPEQWFDDKYREHMTNLAANHYPPQPVPPGPGQLRKGVHRDWGSLTILYQDDAPGGLQVLDQEQRWVDVPAIEGTFVINIGDLMALWTNDRWSSTVHRVVNPPREQAHQDRYSIAFFHQPSPDALISCIPTCADEQRPPRHQAVRSGHYLAGKLRRAYVHRRLGREQHQV